MFRTTLWPIRVTARHFQGPPEPLPGTLYSCGVCAATGAYTAGDSGLGLGLRFGQGLALDHIEPIAKDLSNYQGLPQPLTVVII